MSFFIISCVGDFPRIEQWYRYGGILGFLCQGIKNFDYVYVLWEVVSMIMVMPSYLSEAEPEHLNYFFYHYCYCYYHYYYYYIYHHHYHYHQYSFSRESKRIIIIVIIIVIVVIIIITFIIKIITPLCAVGWCRTHQCFVIFIYHTSWDIGVGLMWTNIEPDTCPCVCHKCHRENFSDIA